MSAMNKYLIAPMLALSLAAQVHAQTTLNVRDADIRAFIADAAKVTGRTFIIDSRVAGKVTVVTDHPLSRSEYFEIFLSTLRANGLVAVPTGNGALRVQPIDNAASQPSRVGVSGASRNSFVTEIIRLRSIDAASALDTVRPLVSAQGAVTANRGGNSLVVVDFADNIRRIRQVLGQIDNNNDTTRVVTLKNANAREIATALSSLSSGAAPAGGGAAANTGAPGASVVAVESSNSVVIRGDTSSVARLAQVAIDLDQKARNGTEIKVVFLGECRRCAIAAGAPAARRADPGPADRDRAEAIDLRPVDDGRVGVAEQHADTGRAASTGEQRGWRRRRGGGIAGGDLRGRRTPVCHHAVPGGECDRDCRARGHPASADASDPAT